MAKRLTRQEVHARLRNYLKRRRELGLRTAILNVVLEPPNPFETAARRHPRKAFVLVVLWLLALAGVFAYFNLGS